jgi:GTP cyclohydrolase I
MKVPKGALPARPERTRITHPEEGGPRPEPFAAKVRDIIAALGEDPGREGLVKTPERVEASLRFLTQGYAMTVEDAIGDAVFEDSHQSMIMVRDIEVYSLCEHHLLPFFGRAHVAYIPNGKILGLSKVARVVDVFARRLQVQERLTDHIADAIMNVLRPTGVGVVIEAAHFCMMMRGVEKQNSRAVTSALRGIFLEDSKTRGEFLRLAHGGHLFE